MELLLIRHGQTTGDIENRYGGDYDDELTEEGIRQSERLAEELADKGVRIVYSSPLKRAQSTAKTISARCLSSLVTLPELKERNYYGVLTGMTKEEALQKYADLVPLLEDRNNTLPGGESYQDFTRRVEDAWSQVTASTYETVAIVTHAGPIRCIFRDVLNKGELGTIGDCAYICISDETGDWKVLKARGIKL